MQFTTSVTQKGQITIPKDIRDKLGIKEYDRVIVSEKNNQISIQPVKDILDFAGSMPVPKNKRKIDTREAFEKNYKRF